MRPTPPQGVRRLEHHMGTVITMDVRDDVALGELDAALDRAFAWLGWVDQTFSTYKPGSEISRLGRGTLALKDCSPEVQEVLARCEELRDFTEGYFDARAGPGRVLDPSGVVKGWAAERASDLLAAAGAVNHCINAAGDVAVRGAPQPGQRWQIGIVHPLQPDALTTIVSLSDGAVATSGTYERGLHVFDPHTGRPAEGLASVSVIGPSLTLADAYATAALAMGTDAPVWLSGLDGYESYVIDNGGFVWSSNGFRAYRALPE